VKNKKYKISQREKNRRLEQSRAQWEKDNPEVAHALKHYKQPVAFSGRIGVFQLP